MSTYMELSRCQVVCSCKKASPLCRVYFCRHCLEIRCSNCVSHEVDSHYCPNCLENMASAEAKMRKQRCGNCFDCPSCGHTLSTRATAVMLPKADDPSKTVPQKAYYLACGFCRWSTRDSGIKDQRQPAGGWLEAVNSDAARIQALIDSYHHLAVEEKAERERSKLVRKRNYMILLERYPVLNPRLRRYCSSSWTTPKSTEPAKEIVIPTAEALTEVAPLDLELYSKTPLHLEKITTVTQRHLAPQLQPELTSQLEPRHKALAVKRSMRCRTCEHNLSKADFNPSSIKFRINLSALYHVPDIRFILPSSVPSEEVTAEDGKTKVTSAASKLCRRTSATLAVLRSQPLVHETISPGKTTHIIITISNPAHRMTTVTLQQLTPEEELIYLSDLVDCTGTTKEKSTDQPKADVGPSIKATAKEESKLQVSSDGQKRSMSPATSRQADRSPALVKQASTKKPLTSKEEHKLTHKKISSPFVPPVSVGSAGDIAVPDACFSTVKLQLPTKELQLSALNDMSEYDEKMNMDMPVEKKDDTKLFAFRRGNKIGIYVGVTPAKTVTRLSASTTSLPPVTEDTTHEIENKPVCSAATIPLRAAVWMHFDYKNTTTTLLSEQRVTTVTAKSGETEKSLSAPAPQDEIHQLRVLTLLHFGDMVVPA